MPLKLAILFLDMTDMNIGKINRSYSSHLKDVPFLPSSLLFLVLLIMNSPHQAPHQLHAGVFSPVQLLSVHAMVFCIRPPHETSIHFAPGLGLTSRSLLVHLQPLELCSSLLCPWDEHWAMQEKGGDQFSWSLSCIWALPACYADIITRPVILHFIRWEPQDLLLCY